MSILSALLWKNAVLKRSRWVASAMELALPLAIVLLFSILKTQTEIFLVPAGWSQLTEACPYDAGEAAKNKSCTYPYANFLKTVPTFDNIARSKLNGAIDGHEFAKLFLAFEDGSESGEAFMDAFSDWAIGGNNTRYLSLFGQSSRIWGNGKESEVEDYIRGESYGRPFTEENPEVAGIIVFNSMNPENEQFKYTIRLNHTASDNTLKTRQTIAGPIYGVGRDVKTADLNVATQGGFMTIQLLLDQFIIGNGQYDSQYMPFHVQAVQFAVKGYEYDEFFDYVKSVFPLVFILSFLWPIAQLIGAMVQEKESRMREMMKMMGANDYHITASWFITYGIYFTVLAFLVTLCCISMFPATSGNGISFLVFFLFWMFGLASLSLCYTISAFFWKARTGSIVGVMLYFLGFFPYFQISDVDTAKPAFLLLIPQISFSLGLQTIAAVEASGTAMSAQIASTEVEGFAFATAIGMLVFDFILFTFLGWYFNLIVPQEFGRRLPFYFLCSPGYWCASHGATVSDTSDAELDEMVTGNGDNIQAVGAHLRGQVAANQCVQIKNIRRVFDTPAGEKVAVKGMRLNMYEGEILALLGHNGAGKTTLLSILGGMLTPSSGTANMRGLDLIKDMRQIRKSLGFCPQHDVLYKSLTVSEHLFFYGKVKGLRGSELAQEVNQKIIEVGLTEKRHIRSGALSGGQKRKLSVAIALIGDSRVVFLDEPTSGMDPYSRRSTWELLQNCRENRIMVLTTHFMDEADILGDRIAIMAEGELRCYGDSLFLKTRYGEGYTLSIVKKETCDAGKVIALMNNMLPGNKLLTNVGAEIVFQLPIDATPQFAQLFTTLDDKLEELGLEQYGISVTTMEEVFLKVASAESHKKQEAQIKLDDHHDDDKSSTSLDRDSATFKDTSPDVSINVQDDVDSATPVRNQVTFSGQFATLFKKRFRYARRDCKACCCVALLPVILIFMGMALLEFNGFGMDMPERVITLDDYNPDYPDDKLVVPFIELDEQGMPTSAILKPQYADSGVALKDFHPVDERFNYTDEKVDEVFTRKYINGIPAPEECAVSGVSCEIIEESTGTALLSLAEDLIATAAEPSNNGTSVYLSTILQKKPLPRKQCLTSTLMSSLGSTLDAATLLNTNVVTCSREADNCLYVELEVPSIGIPGFGATGDLHVCIPAGCAQDSAPLLAQLTSGLAAAGGAGALPDTGGLITPEQLTAMLESLQLFGCDGERCNTMPDLAQFLSGLSTCRAETESGGTCALKNLIPLEVTEDGLEIDVTVDRCGDDEIVERTLSGVEFETSNGAEFPPNDRADFPPSNHAHLWTLQESMNRNLLVAEDCATVTNATECANTYDNCQFLVPLNKCTTKCSIFGTIGECVNAGCEWDGICLLGCSLATSEAECATASEQVPEMTCEWDGAANACDAVRRYSYVSIVNSTSRYGAMVHMNMMNSLLHKYRLDSEGDGAKKPSITVVSHPLPNTKNFEELLGAFMAFTAAIFIVIAYAFIPAAVMGYVVMEKEKVKHQQIVSGVGLLPYWTSLFVFDFLSFLFPAFATVAIIVGFQVESFMSDGALGAMFVVLIGYGLAVLPFTYVLSHLFDKHTSAQNAALFINLLTGLVLMIVSFVLDVLETTKDINPTLKFIYRIFPGFCLGDSFQQLSIRSITAAFFSSNDLDAETPSPFTLDITGYNLIYLYISFLVWSALALGIDFWKSYPKLHAQMFSKNQPSSAEVAREADRDDDVVAEECRVKELVNSGNLTGDIVVIDSLRKAYGNGKVAVKNVTLGIHEGECFGYLGINGAGKTSTMKCLTGDVYPTSGTAYLKGLDIQEHPMEVRQSIGYCPQFDALLDLLTVREHLELYANIKGIPNHLVDSVIRDKMKELTLTEFENKLAKTLSGGNKRKLSVAIAMLGDPPVMFLDEPSTGMDPVSRRFMWQVINNMSQGSKKTAVVLTTHSMEECEALCSRVGIMISGGLRCLGSVQHLKTKYGNGLMVDMTLMHATEKEVDALVQELGVADQSLTLEEVEELVSSAKHEMFSNYDARLQSIKDKDDRAWTVWRALEIDGRVNSEVLISWWLLDNKGRQLEQFMLYHFPEHTLIETHETHFRYQVPKGKVEEKGLGAMFALFEGNKKTLDLSEYSISQTSLEQIFNQFAATQTEEQGVARGLNKAGE